MPPQLSPEQSQSLCHHTGDMSVTVSITNNDPFHNYSHLNNHKNRIDYCCKYNGKMKWRNINSIIYSTQNEKINSILGSHKFRQPRTRTIFVSSLPFIILLFTSWSSLTSFCQTLWVLPQTQKAEQNLRWQQAGKIGNYSVIFALLNTFPIVFCCHFRLKMFIQVIGM